MKYNPAKKCFVNDDGSKIVPYVSLCTRYGNISDSCLSKSGYQRYCASMVKDLSKIPGGMDGLYQVDGHYRSEKLDRMEGK